MRIRLGAIAATLLCALPCAAGVSPPDTALLALPEEVLVVRDVMAGSPKVGGALVPSAESKQLVGHALAPDGNSAIVLHRTIGRLIGGVFHVDSAGLSVFTGLAGPGPYAEQVLTEEDGIGVPLEVSYLPDGRSAVLLGVDLATGASYDSLTLKVLTGLPDDPHLEPGELFLAEANGALMEVSPHDMAVSPDCRSVVIAGGNHDEVALVEIQIQWRSPPQLTQRDAFHVDLGLSNEGNLAFGAQSNHLLVADTNIGKGPGKLYLFDEVRDKRLHLLQKVVLNNGVDKWWSVATLPKPNRFIASAGEMGFGPRIHFFDGLESGIPQRTAVQKWDVNIVAGSIQVMPDGDTILAGATLGGSLEWKFFQGIRDDRAVEIATLGPMGFADDAAVPMFLPPVIPEAGAAATVEADEDCLGHITLEGSAAFDAACAPDPDEKVLDFSWWLGGTLLAEGRAADVELGLGTHELVFRVVDTSQRTWEDTVEITVVDVTPPAFEVLEPDPATLWPPNHELRPVHVDLEVRDNCDPDPKITLAEATSSERADDRGDGHTEPDIEEALLGADDRDLLLRAERDGRGEGRTYRLRYGAEDFSGNAAEAEAIVEVPHDQRSR